MRTPASIAGHPLHAMLIVFPVGLLIFSLICDLFSLRAAEPAVWVAVALYTMVGGFISALIVAVPGLIDLLSLQDPATKKIALIHMSINLLVVAIYVCNSWLRHGDPQALKIPMIMSLVTVLLLLVSGWLGGKMVFEAGVGVDTGAPR